VALTRTHRYTIAIVLGVLVVPVVWLLVSRTQSPQDNINARISKMQGWSLQDAALEQRVTHEVLDLKKAPDENEWTQIVDAKKRDSLGFTEDMMDIAAVDKDPRHQEVLKSWCIELMNFDPSQNEYRGLNGYWGYLHTNATPSEIASWRAKLLLRGGPYTERIPLFDEKVAKSKGLAH
jgi:hypothetical protein